MLILQALFLWLIVSTLMIGGAMLFHRLYPDESPWFGFIVPPLAIVLLFNFIEHLVALPTLLLLLPLFLGATIWMAVSGKYFTRALILPSAIFLASFAFTFGIRCLQPDISYTSDGISDLNMVNNFSKARHCRRPTPGCRPIASSGIMTCNITPRRWSSGSSRSRWAWPTMSPTRCSRR